MNSPASDQKNHPDSKPINLALIPIGIAINLGIGAVVQMLKLPIYLDAVGTVIVTLLAGFRIGATTGVASFLIGGVLVTPVLPYFCGTQLAIAAFVSLMARSGGYRTMLRSVASGVGLGVVAGIVSAPVIVIVFGGVDGTSGASFVTAWLLASGKQVLEAVFISGLAAEPIDKTLQTLLAVWIIRGLPSSVLVRLPGPHLEKNGLRKK